MVKSLKKTWQGRRKRGKVKKAKSPKRQVTPPIRLPISLPSAIRHLPPGRWQRPDSRVRLEMVGAAVMAPCVAARPRSMAMAMARASEASDDKRRAPTRSASRRPRDEFPKLWLCPFCHLLSSSVIFCHLLSSSVIFCHLLSSSVIFCHLLSLVSIFLRLEPDRKARKPRKAT